MGARGGRGLRFAPPRVPAPGLGARSQQNRCACSGLSPPRPGSRGRRARTQGNGCQSQVSPRPHTDTCLAPLPLLRGDLGLRSPTAPAPHFLGIPRSPRQRPPTALAPLSCQPADVLPYSPRSSAPHCFSPAPHSPTQATSPHSPTPSFSALPLTAPPTPPNRPSQPRPSPEIPTNPV